MAVSNSPADALSLLPSLFFISAPFLFHRFPHRKYSLLTDIKEPGNFIVPVCFMAFGQTFVSVFLIPVSENFLSVFF